MAFFDKSKAAVSGRIYVLTGGGVIFFSAVLLIMTGSASLTAAVFIALALGACLSLFWTQMQLNHRLTDLQAKLDQNEQALEMEIRLNGQIVDVSDQFKRTALELSQSTEEMKQRLTRLDANNKALAKQVHALAGRMRQLPDTSIVKSEALSDASSNSISTDKEKSAQNAADRIEAAVSMLEEVSLKSSQTAGAHSAEHKEAAAQEDKAPSEKTNRTPEGNGETNSQKASAVSKPVSEKSRASRTRDAAMALTQDKLSLHMQPIVTLKDRKPVSYEAFMRLQTGQGDYLSREEFAQLSESGALTAAIDKKVVASALRLLDSFSKSKKEARFFCGLGRQSLKDTACFERICSHLLDNKAFADRLVLDIHQEHFNALNAAQRNRLSRITDAGFKLSLSELRTEEFDLESLSSEGFGYLRIPAEILYHANLAETLSALSPSSLVREAAVHRLDIIATHVERESGVGELTDFNVHLVQGSLFAPPRPVKQDFQDIPGEEPQLGTGLAGASAGLS